MVLWKDSFKDCSAKITLSYVGQELTNGVSYSAKPNNDIEGTLDTKQELIQLQIGQVKQKVLMLI